MMCTANIYSQITVGFATQPKSVLTTVKLQPMAVKTTVIDLEDYSYSLSDVFGYNMCSKITVGYATQLKAVPSTVKIFAVWNTLIFRLYNEKSFVSVSRLKSNRNKNAL